MKKHYVAISLSLSMSILANLPAAFADDSDESVSSIHAPKSILENKEFEDTKTLTDPNLRANDGSLSRYSFKESLTYNGPSMGDLSAQNQPNPDKSVGNFAQKITGNTSVNYRLDSTHSLSGGIGLIYSYPFAGQDQADKLLAKSSSGSSQYSMNNPFVSYNVASRWDTLQMRNSFMLIDSTQPVYTSLGEVGGLNYYNGLVYGLGTSRTSLTLDTNIYYWAFGRAYNPETRAQGGDAGSGIVQQYTVSVTPGIKYNFTDSLNAYTSAGLGWINPRDNTGDMTVWLPRSLAMSGGIGWAYRRDIYITPYITTYPLSSHESWSETSLNVSTVFSLL